MKNARFECVDKELESRSKTSQESTKMADIHSLRANTIDDVEEHQTVL